MSIWIYLGAIFSGLIIWQIIESIWNKIKGVKSEKTIPPAIRNFTIKRIKSMIEENKITKEELFGNE